MKWRRRIDSFPLYLFLFVAISFFVHDLTKSLLCSCTGPERRKAVISDKDKKLTAYHEAGVCLYVLLLS